MSVITLSLILLALLLLAFLIVVFRKPRILVCEDGVLIKDFLYPAKIFANTIVSVELVDNLPKVVARTNGCNGLNMWKGFFKVKPVDKNKVVFYVDKHRNGPFIKITTCGTTIYINKSSRERTLWLYEEMNSKVKRVENSMLVCSKVPSARSIVSVVVFITLIVCVSLLPMLLPCSKTMFVLDADSLEIKGMFSMDIPFSEIDSVGLIDEMPEISVMRNGFSTRKAAVGQYEVGGVKCRLYLLDKRNPPYIIIKSDGKLLYLNDTESNETISLYNVLNNK
ncbi:MAG: hypothetical protein ACI358_07485 [Candidatus Limimorpha sp.]